MLISRFLTQEEAFDYVLRQFKSGSKKEEGMKNDQLNSDFDIKNTIIKSFSNWVEGKKQERNSFEVDWDLIYTPDEKKQFVKGGDPDVLE